ncbi:MAG: hypothetical protein ACD_13C00219G0006 [uncultured bacterium]|uniref:Uncharacterized protein n=1 Tax=Candidatus Woesebacteria bacterium GW2011_GWA1_40_43 TaxID=1618553 RepID=A0A0G0VLM6_9BACT|nr:MAG: hypothetical protein ACD_13C00219G0006 [uncultured bacterium]KKR51918.1 MAG: hypothetical protein UT88_C0026G0009 [Candidatus Woesebacteria bacterium GW2011_GWD2_40_19]KKR57772.1 MAG: hypothetical protein UT96_C0014G0005 [Candidatus Woesebacteria bacterium GW2011_GWC2_40_30]KKR63692.1 MAG: hypothetical protein UU02_C0021G0008 [Candidatus Woesebacteria bacterium GW2011_GWA1_40_43]HAU65484.1 hypothetical protein [Candidatus Woesebacteria bacterium]
MTLERGGFYTKNDRYRDARLNAMLDAYSAGRTSTQELENAAGIAMRKIAAKTGFDSEKRFTKFALHSEQIKSVTKSSINDDAYKGIDNWVSFNERLNMPTLPVQIKSSDGGVREFRKTKQYKNLNEMVIVINCGPRVTKKKFCKQLYSETGRIRKILNK